MLVVINKTKTSLLFLLLLGLALISCGGNSSTATSPAPKLISESSNLNLLQIRSAPPPSAGGAIGSAPASETDTDGDSFVDSVDIDDDGDGLIEILTAEEFNAIRYNLAGTNLTMTGGGAGDATGCGGQIGITSCSGYELNNDINLAQHSDWQPIGNCLSDLSCPDNIAFGAKFEGNGHIISNIRINLTADAYGVGLFGSTTDKASFNNLTLHNVSIHSSEGGAGLGGLVGSGADTNFTSITIEDLNINVDRVDGLGGLVGAISGAVISSALVKNGTIIGTGENTGGLVGTGDNVEIVLSSVNADTIKSSRGSNIGGLVGVGTDIIITSSFASVDARIEGAENVGGLVGSGVNAKVYSSSVVAENIKAIRSIAGGLIGEGDHALIIYSSLAAVESITAAENVGGLLGHALGGDIISSLALVKSLSTDGAHIGAIAGTYSGIAYLHTIEDSYWLNSTQFSPRPPNDNSRLNTGKNLRDLRTPTSFAGIYANWGTAWCDPNTGEFSNNPADRLAVAGGGDAYRVWDLGGAMQYPAIRCLGATIPLSEQRRLMLKVIDSDGDGKNDSADNCPSDPNPEQYNNDTDTMGDACDLDDDDDRVLDVMDNCPLMPNSDQGNKDGDEFGDACDYDSDNDKIPDLTDNCRFDWNPDQNNTDGADDGGDACDTDDDDDLVLDNDDNCPLTPNHDQRNTDGASDGGDACDSDDDDDNIPDETDVDDDGDGLIEISTAYQLNNIRYILDGTGYANSSNAADKRSDGCPSNKYPATDAEGKGILDREGNLIYACYGYELNASISLAADYPNWTPIGRCESASRCRSFFFSGTFDGNGHSINNIRISRNSESYGVGLFGAVANHAFFRNLTLQNIDISSNSHGNAFGSLAGYGLNARFKNINVYDVMITANQASRIGGLLGSGVGAQISSVSVVVDSIAGRNAVGALMGYGFNGFEHDVNISGASVRGGNITGYNAVGGLVGEADHSFISSSSVIVEGIDGSESVGGLVGQGYYARVSMSSVFADTIDGLEKNVGGLIGDGYRAEIEHSSALAMNITGQANVGGLIGIGTLSTVRSTLALAGAIASTTGAGGIVGASGDDKRGSSFDPSSVDYSYWINSIQFTDAAQPSTNTFGNNKTATELRHPTDFIDIYANWGNAWCDPDTGEFTYNLNHRLATAGGGDTYRAWNLGNNTEYPVLRCFGDRNAVSEQRAAIDLDRDGYLNFLDPIPNSTAADVAQGDIDGDGYFGEEDPDDDNDGHDDADDNCPLVPNEDQANKDNDKQGDACDADDDDDGVDDFHADGKTHLDNCRFIPNTDQANNDTDEYGDACDIDYDGDGLIEIETAIELSNIRHNLAGTAYATKIGDAGNSIGCGGQPGITKCNGYELTTNISLSTYNWVPIGSCDHPEPNDRYSSLRAACPDDTSFNGRFEGNGYSISGLRVSLSSSAFGVGLFGSVKRPASLSNLILDGVSITTGTWWGENVGALAGHGNGASFSYISVKSLNIDAGGAKKVGGLVGWGTGAQVSHSSINAATITSYDRVGGIVGSGDNAVISSSSVILDTIGVGDDSQNIGGLIGLGVEARISHSSVNATAIKGKKRVGGLVGTGEDAIISSSSVIADTIGAEALKGGWNHGGLVGYGEGVNITASSVVMRYISGNTRVGGLVGRGNNANIFSSSVIARNIRSDANEVGGLIGYASGARISSSLVLADNIYGSQNAGAMVGTDIGNGNIADSYWLNTLLLVGHSQNIEGASKSALELQDQNSFADIYRNWADAWCNPQNGEVIRGSANPGDSYLRVWDLGTTHDYPVINCLGDKFTSDAQLQAIRSLIDSDRDGHIDADDNCPRDQNPEQLDNDTDSLGDACDNDIDGDGVLNLADNCPFHANPEQRDLDNDLKGDDCDEIDNRHDSDGDGIHNNLDNCSYVPNPDQRNTDGAEDGGDACDDDDDNDGVNDFNADGTTRLDNCQFTPNPDQRNTDGAEDGGDACDTDDDDDGTLDITDIDDDGDGLIEIETAHEFDSTRHSLSGDGYKLSSRVDKVTEGCPTESSPGTDAEGNSVTVCRGYELIADISLADYSEWEPIGSCTASNQCPEVFTGKFNGNGHSISDIRINKPSYTFGVGLFGAVGPGASLSNLILRNVDITSIPTSARDGGDWGSLVGYGIQANFNSTSVENVNISISNVRTVGGLVGDAFQSTISTSSVIAGTIRSTGAYIGGLVGRGAGAQISSSAVVIKDITGMLHVGGLVGGGAAIKIEFSSVAVNSITGTYAVGGLTGSRSDRIRGSLFLGQSISSSGYSGYLSASRSSNVEGSYWFLGGGELLPSTGHPNTQGTNQSKSDLQAPTSFTGSIYATWANAWCNPVTGKVSSATTSPSINYVRTWDLGTDTQYPVINCLGDRLTPSQQRTAINKVLAGELPLPLASR